MRMLFFAHSGLRYLVLLLAAAAVVYFAYAAFSGKGSERTSRILGASFVGFLDLQILIGLVMVALGFYYPALLGHIFMMVGAAVVAHVSLALARSSPPERASRIRLLGAGVAIVLIVGGIMAIGRSVFGTGVPSM